MICPNCGKETSGKFCPHCGTRMPEAAPLDPIVPPLPESPVIPSPSVVMQTQAPVMEQSFPSQDDFPETQALDPEMLNQARPAAPVTPQGQRPQAQNSVPAFGYAPQGQPGFGANPQPGNSQSRPQNSLPNQSYANVPGYVPAQGSNPVQAGGSGAVNPNLVDPGNSPARALIRKLASSPLYLLTVILFTAALVLSAIPYVKQLILFVEYYDYYRSDPSAWSTVGSYVGSVLVELLMGIALWSIFFAALRRNPVRMRTGGLSAVKLYLIIGMVVLILGLIAIAGLTVYVAAVADGSALNQIQEKFLELLRQYNYTYQETAELSFQTLLIVLGCSVFLGLLIAVIFFGKLIKTINTVKRVIRIGYPDDRVSPFAGVLCILMGLAEIAAGVSTLLRDSQQLLQGVAVLCSALCLIFFGVLIFQYRGKMRALGVYRGVSTPNPNR